MNTQSKKGIIYTITGTILGLIISMGGYLITALIWDAAATAATAGSFGVAGFIMGGYFGYILSHFNYDGLYKHLQKNVK